MNQLSKWLQKPHKNQFYSVSRKEYYLNLSTPKDVEDIIFKIKTIEKEHIYSEKSIKFNGIALGTSQYSFIEQGNTPHYEITNIHLGCITHTIFFYSEKIGKHKVFSQYHFVNDMLLWGVYLFENKLSRFEMIEIENTLKKKYDIKEEVTFENTLLVDEHKNKLELKNEVITAINYISGNEQVISNLAKMIAEHKTAVKIQTTEENKNLFNKL